VGNVTPVTSAVLLSHSSRGTDDGLNIIRNGIPSEDVPPVGLEETRAVSGGEVKIIATSLERVRARGGIDGGGDDAAPMRGKESSLSTGVGLMGEG